MESAFRVLHALSGSSRSNVLLGTFVLVLALLPALAAAGSPSHQAEVHPQVWQALAHGGEADVLVVLRAQADLGGAAALSSKEAQGRYVYEKLWALAQESQRGLRALLDAQQASYRSFYIVNAVEVHADRALVQALATRPEVGRIVPNPSVRGLPPEPSRTIPEAAPPSAAASIELNLIRVHADDVWTLGYTGQGIVVAGHDTGYDWDHPALRNQYRGWNGTTADHDYNWHDAIHSGGGECGPDSPEPCDDHGHGTHTMGIMVGDDGEGHRIGMAPGARWIGCRNMDVGIGTPATYIECFEFFLAPYPVGGTPADGVPELAPDVINNSWGCPTDEGCDAAAIALLEASVEALRQAGIVVVASAGNYGSACGTVNYPPAIYPQSFTVGNFDHSTDLIYSSSSRGPVTYGGETYTKPDLTAPGVRIYSSLRDAGYGTLTGTSMSGPHVAGAVALLLSAAPGYRGQVEAVESLLTHTAEPKLDSQCGEPGLPNNVWGWGVLDVLAAVGEATAGTLGGTVTDGSSGLALAGAEVTADLAAMPGVGAAASTTPSGTYTLTLTAGTYQVTAQAEGYASQTVTSVVVISGAVTIQDFAPMPLPRLYLPLVARDF